MFEDAVSFTGKNIDKLETLAVTKMTSMFKGATVFNSACAASSTNTNIWKVEVITFVSMFEGASTFNKPVSTWTFGPGTIVAATGFTNMFKNAAAFNSPIFKVAANWN